MEARVPTAGWAGRRTRVAGSAHLGLAGVVNAVTGVWLVWIAGSEWATRWLIDLFVGTLGELGGLYRGDLISLLSNWVLLALGVLVLVVAGGQLLSAWRAYGGRSPRHAIGMSLAGSLNPAALPLGLVAAALIAVSRDDFADEAETAA